MSQSIKATEQDLTTFADSLFDAVPADVLIPASDKVIAASVELDTAIAAVNAIILAQRFHEVPDARKTADKALEDYNDALMAKYYDEFHATPCASMAAIEKGEVTVATIKTAKSGNGIERGEKLETIDLQCVAIHKPSTTFARDERWGIKVEALNHAMANNIASYKDIEKGKRINKDMQAMAARIIGVEVESIKTPKGLKTALQSIADMFGEIPIRDTDVFIMSSFFFGKGKGINGTKVAMSDTFRKNLMSVLHCALCAKKYEMN